MVKDLFNAYVRPLVRSAGIDVVKYRQVPTDFDDLHRRIWSAVSEYTMTTPERVHAVIEATKYVVRSGIPGAFVECGVWRGGSSMAMAMTLLEMGINDRELYLYDTFAGMSEPTEADTYHDGRAGQLEYDRNVIDESTNDWCRSPIEEVAANLARTGYPREMIKLVQGKVEESIPGTLPGKTALLRLDTDWYESTRHEMIYLYPLLELGGVLIIDDYGTWMGARKAIDEYIASLERPLLLNRIDHTGRIAIRTA